MALPEIIKDIDARVKDTGDTMTGNLTAPTFIGSLQGNASSSTYSTYTCFQDTRNVNEMPLDMLSGISLHLKSNSIDGLSDGLSHHPVLMLRDWYDLSGGPFVELTITGNQNLYFRSSTINADNTWNPWRKVLTDYNYTSILNNTYLPLTGGTLSGNLQINGYLRVGNHASGDNNYIAFYGVTGDAPGSYDHCFIGENLWSESTESSELVLFKGNDFGGDNPSIPATPGPDRIRHIAAGHVFQVYSSSEVHGSFKEVCNSTIPNTILEIKSSGLNINGATTISGTCTVGSIVSNGGTMNGTLYFSEGLGLQGTMGGGTDWWELKGTGTDDAGRCQLIIADNYDSDYFDIIFSNYDGTSVTALSACGVRIDARVPLYGAVWNDYAEYRESDITQPGRCIIENGDDTLRLSTERLQRGAEIVSDTFGFAIGETDTCKTPIAASGRVLAYGYEDREQFKSHIGYPVCSGPNGTVSIMTDEEEQLYPSRIIGYISAVPDYEIWGTGNVKVDGRIWIRIK